MRVWLARVFIGLAFSFLLAHNLILHHHDDEAVEYTTEHHDHDDDHSTTPFDNVKLDGDFVQKLDFQHLDVGWPVDLVSVVYNFMQQPVILIRGQVLLPPEYPPSLYNLDASCLRGPPVYC